ncbi:RT0821/Lpp0805 family surface protein [Methylobacterium sp. Leaf118]|uniref:RT0821/Lpp0805 family surface protein n=1 Tax=Methylobacterium sp. Leaf118 TaxID=2876562 RepID=UPI001E4A2D71|nr:RT0821/Lpp0805 family surface protein [Methylobacterium sp. Leaf118]
MRVRLCKVLACLAAGLAAATSAGCSGPILSFKAKEAPTTPEPTVTGSIPKRPTSFGRDLDDEDWRRAHGALSLALDPQGNGRPVKWDNPDTAMRGSVNPTGLPYVAGDEICRDFLATIVGDPAGKGAGKGAGKEIGPGARSRFLRGTGCKLSGGVWELKRLRSGRG